MSLRGLQASLVAEREQVLRELGLVPKAGVAAASPPQKKRQRAAEEAAAPLRRSNRSFAAPATYTEAHVELPAPRRSTAAAEEDVDDDEPRGFLPAVPGSLRATPARVAHMNATFLGCPVPMALGGPGNQAKRAVMNAACGTPGVRPSFSRMSGVQVWENAIFLFVNVTTGANLFLDGGREVTWFAQNTHKPASPVILRLVHHATGFPPPPAAAGAGNGPAASAPPASEVALDPCDVALILRVGTEPYVWAGRLEYVRHDPRSRPIKFWWRLRDFDALAAKPEFRRVLEHASSSG